MHKHDLKPGTGTGDLPKDGTDSAGFQFIVTTPSHRSSQDYQKLIRRHVTRGKTRRKHRPQMQSWIAENAEEHPQSDTTIPIRVGSDLSSIQFPESIKACMIQDIIKFLTIVQAGLYPTEICVHVDSNSVDSSWIGYLLSDPVYLHSMLYSTEAYFDEQSGRQRSTLAHFYFLKTLRLLQDRISNSDDPLAVSNETIMTVVTLAMVADFFHDRDSMENHVGGLRKILGLRGGIKALKSKIDDDLPAKICRVDIGLALRSGHRPAFAKHEISWDPYLVGPKLDQPSKTMVEGEIPTFINTMDSKLTNVWQDLHQFSDISNLASQTKYKLPLATFSEIMISVLYRLLQLSFKDSLLDEAFRLGMLVFTRDIYLRWGHVNQGQDRLSEEFSNVLSKLHRSAILVPRPMIFWLLVVYRKSVSAGSSLDRHSSWLDEVIEAIPLSCWEDSRKALKLIIWIDTLNDSGGKVVFNNAMRRIELMKGGDKDFGGVS